MAMKPSLRTIHHWSVEIGKSYKTVQGWLANSNADGQEKRGKGMQPLYYLKTVLEAARGIPDPRAEAEWLDPDQERARKDKETADKLAMENAVRRRDLVDIASVSSVWIDQMAGMRAKLLSMPTKLGPQLINVPDARIVADKIQDEVHSALNELAELSFDSEEAPSERSSNIESAAEADGEPMGRRRKKVK